MTALRQHAVTFEVPTRPFAFADVTATVQAFVADSGVREGLATLFIQHTSASLVIQENADPAVLADLADALSAAAPEGAGWRHDAEGPDDMPAHVKSALTATSLSIPILGGALALGTWQAVYVAEHRAQPHLRTIAVHILGA